MLCEDQTVFEMKLKIEMDVWLGVFMNQSKLISKYLSISKHFSWKYIHCLLQIKVNRNRIKKVFLIKADVIPLSLSLSLCQSCFKLF